MFSKHQNKAEFRNLDDSAFISSECVLINPCSSVELAVMDRFQLSYFASRFVMTIMIEVLKMKRTFFQAPENTLHQMLGDIKVKEN